MFADFVEFETNHSTVSINRNHIIHVQLTENWRNAPPVGIGQTPPPLARTTVIVRAVFDSVNGGEWITYEFNTEETAKRVYELIRDGAVPPLDERT